MVQTALRNQELITQYYGCDDRAFDELEKQITPAKCAYFCSHGCPAEDAYDLVQEVLIRVATTKNSPYEWSPETRGGASFSTWLGTITSNVLYDYFRSKGRKPESFFQDACGDLEDAEPFEERIPDDDPGPLDQLLVEVEGDFAAKIIRYVGESLEQLSDEERLIMTSWTGTSRKPCLGEIETLEEVAEVLQSAGFEHLSLATLSRRANSAWKKMSDYLEKIARTDEDLRIWLRKFRKPST